MSVPDSCWFLFSVQEERPDCRLSVTTTRHKRNLKIVAGWRLLWCGGAVVINYRVSAVGVVVAAGNVDKICNCSFGTLPNDNEYNRANES